MAFNVSAGTTDMMNVTLGQCIIDTSSTMIEQFLSLFYIMNPYEHTKDNAEDVPNYEVMLFPVIGILVILEQVIRFFKRQDISRMQDIVVNSGAALLFTLTRTLMLSIVIVVYSWVYNNYRILDLPLHSIWTWLFSLLLVEFMYYWTHRALHEINILWAAHQFHHMAEDVNITTTIRDSVVDLVLYDIFPLPLALFAPPQILVVHMQFSLIYQIWLHNEVIGHLGPLEYLINTPRQHRVHHGKNPYCIDKNYGALLMIWDRLFGTYQEEKEKIVFGVVSPTPQTFDSMTLQFGYYRDVLKKFNEVNGFGNKMSALFKGPGWSPGKPRLGLIKEVPEPDPAAPKYSYDPYIPVWRKYYVFIHGSIVSGAFYLLADHPSIKYSASKGLAAILYIILILTSFGAIFDIRRFAAHLEIVRCLIYFAFDHYVVASVDWPLDANELFVLRSTLWSIRVIHVLSILFWFANILMPKKKRNSVEKPLKDVERDSFEEQDIHSVFVKVLFALGGLLLIGGSFSMYTYVVPSCRALTNQNIEWLRTNVLGCLIK